MKKELFDKLYKEHIEPVLRPAYLQVLTKSFEPHEAKELWSKPSFHVLINADNTKLFFSVARLSSRKQIYGFVYDIPSNQLLPYRTLKLQATHAGIYYFLADGVKFNYIILAKVVLPKTEGAPKNAVKISHNGKRPVIEPVHVAISDMVQIREEVGGDLATTVVTIDTLHAPVFDVMLFTDNQHLPSEIPPTMIIVQGSKITEYIHGNVVIVRVSDEYRLPLSPSEQEAVIYALRNLYYIDYKNGQGESPVFVCRK